MDPADRLPRRFPITVWVTVATVMVLVYVVLWGFVHIYVDTRICLTTLPDPLFAILPEDQRWTLFTHEIFSAATFITVAAAGVQAWQSDHRPLLRFAGAMTVQAALRSVTLLLTPICHPSVAPGHAALTSFPSHHVFGFTFSWRPWATNDLMFSGHVGQMLLFSLAVNGTWPRTARLALVAFQLADVVALASCREHYTIDMIVAVPCAFFADRVACALLAMWTRRRASIRVPGFIEAAAAEHGSMGSHATSHDPA